MSMPDNDDARHVSSTHQAHTLRANEVTVLRELVKIYELESANNQVVSTQLRRITQSRVYPLMILIVKIVNVIEGSLRRRLGKAPLGGDLIAVPSPRPVMSREESGPAVAPTAPNGEANSWGYRLFFLKRGLSIFLHAFKVLIRGNGGRQSPRLEANSYAAWALYYRKFTIQVRDHLERRMVLFTKQPLLSIVMATYNTDHTFLREAIDSVLDQIYPHFELLIADDCSPDATVRAIVAEYAKKDSRVKLITREDNGNISAATNSAIAQATGEYVVFMDHDDTIVPHALFHVVLSLHEYPDATLLYSDEDKLNEANEVFMPYFKSDFDPLLLLGQNYVCHLTTVRRDLLTELGGLRSEFDGAQDWDLVLRVSEVVDRSTIIHIPHVLYHWRSHAGSTSQSSEAKPWALTAGRRAVGAALERRGVAGEVREVGSTGFADVYFALPENPPLVSIMIPTRDGIYLQDCVRSVLADTTYPTYEIIIIDNGSVKADTLAFFDSLDERVRVVRDVRPFNYSALHNNAVEACRGEVLCLLNDDTTVITPDWLSAMVAQLLQPGNGLVGAKLLYPDGRIQHAGVLLGLNGLAAHVGQFHAGNDLGYFGRMALASEFQACTAACIVVRRATWDAVGGLDESLQVAFNDVDFCLKVQRTGLTVSYTPHAQLVHYESVSRGLDIVDDKYRRFMSEVLTVRDRWGLEIARDPYYNPNLSLNHGVWELAYPPRCSPWYTGVE
jgi:glycosyltransferase involved in cell wall biosynthesis